MDKTQTKKIGLFGGTFDPIHTGHLMIAEIIREELCLDKLLFIPTKIHPLKENRVIQSAYHRRNMLKLAIEDNPHFLISDNELEKEGTSYTIDTIKAFRRKYPPNRYELYFLLGSDNVDQFHLWKEPDELVKLCNIITFGRPGFQPDIESNRYLAGSRFIEIPLLEISSTEIRKRARENRSIRYLVPPQVEAYIEKNTLYRTS